MLSVRPSTVTRRSGTATLTTRSRQNRLEHEQAEDAVDEIEEPEHVL